MSVLRLPSAAWRERKGLNDLATALGEGQARYVGGAVRDTLLGLPVEDIDIASPLLPEQVVTRVREAGFKAVPTGIAHGTITVVLPSGPVEVTTLRRDIATNGRHAIVAFADDWREDAARRDFTINALYADAASGEIFDYFDGLSDLQRRHVRFIGEPLRRIAEDHLRILRFFRFVARFGEHPDPAGLAACIARSNDLMALSRERIRDELTKLLVTRNAVAMLRLMIDAGVLRPVLPEIQMAGVTRLQTLTAHEAEYGVEPDPIRRLAALVEPRDAEAIGARLKLSNAQRKRLEGATAGSGDEGLEGLAYRVGAVHAVDRLLLTGQDPSAIMGRDIPRLPLSGSAIIARGVAPGPAVARLLQEVERRWIAAGFPDDVGAIADAVVAQAAPPVSKS